MADSANSPELTAKGRATRDRIVVTAADLIYQQGVARTSLQEVQQAAHVSGSQLSHYFRDKSTLVHAVVGLRQEMLFKHQAPWLTRIDSVKSIRAWRDYVVDFARRHECRGGCPLGSLVSELADLDPSARSTLSETFQDLTAVFQRGLEAMQDRGELDTAADPTQLASALVSAMEGGLLLAKAYRNVTPLAAGLDTVIERIASLTPLVPRSGSQVRGPARRRASRASGATGRQA